MPQFDYFGTWDDSIAVLRQIFEFSSIRVVHDSGIWHEPSARYFNSLDDELLRLLEWRPFLYLYGGFSRFPPGFVLLDTGPHAGAYYLAINEGGPGLELGMPVCRKTQDTIELGSRFLSYPAKYHNPDAQLWEKQPPELHSAYLGLKSLMKKRLCRMKVKKQNYVGPQALELLIQGKATIIDRGV